MISKRRSFAPWAGRLRNLPAYRLCALTCWVGVFASLASININAQILRCTDSRTDKVTYTDGTCTSGQSVKEVEARKSPEQLENDRAQADTALKAKHERQALQAQADEQQQKRQSRDAHEPTFLQQPRAPEDYGHSIACSQARANLSTAVANLARTPEEQATRIDAAQQQMDYACLGPADYAQAQTRRANQAPALVVVQPPAWQDRPRPGWQGRPDRPLPANRPHISECTSFTCTDTNGKRYPRTGRGSFQER